MRLLSRTFLVVCLTVFSTGQAGAVVAVATPQLPDPGETGVSKAEQEKIGTQAVSEVYQQMPVLPDSSAQTRYIEQLGGKLKSVIPQQYSWPYQFHVIAQKEINAFAVPGGPIFVNLGTITAAANEAQLAGVMAHEMAHIYMQHSIKQMKKQQLQQGIFGILGAVLGQAGGVAGTLGQLGLGIGNGLLTLKYSRSDEEQADAVGAIILYKAGYDPVAMANFFQTLEQQGGGNGPNFMSDHPNPGNRVQSIQEEISHWPAVRSSYNNAEFVRVRQASQSIRTYTAQEIAQGAKDGTWVRQNRQSGAFAPGAGARENISQPLPSGSGSSSTLANVTFAQISPNTSIRKLQTSFVQLSYPDNWQVVNDGDQQGITIAPPAGAAEGTIAYGMILHALADQGGSLTNETQSLVAALQKSNTGLQATSEPQRLRVNNVYGLSVELSGPSPVQQNGQALREQDWLVTVPQSSGRGLVYFICIAPQPDFGRLRPTFQRMLDSVQLP